MAIQEIILGNAPDIQPETTEQPKYREIDLGSIEEPKNMLSLSAQEPISGFKNFFRQVEMPLDRIFEAFNKSGVSFNTTANDITKYIGKKLTALPGHEGDSTKDWDKFSDYLWGTAAKKFQENADFWKKRQDEVGGATAITEIFGDIIGSTPGGITEFMLNVPYAGLKGASEAEKEDENEALGSLIGIAGRYGMGKVFSAMSPYSKAVKTTLLPLIFGGQAALEGGDKMEVAKGVGAGLAFGLAGKGGELGFKDIGGLRPAQISQKRPRIVQGAKTPPAPTQTTPEAKIAPKVSQKWLDLTAERENYKPGSPQRIAIDKQIAIEQEAMRPKGTPLQEAQAKAVGDLPLGSAEVLSQKLVQTGADLANVGQPRSEIPQEPPPSPPTPPVIPPKASQPSILPQKPRGKIATFGERLYQGIFNKFHAIEKIAERAEKAGIKLEPGEHPTFRSRGYLGIAGKVQSVLQDKTYSITKEGKYKITGEGLKPILKDFGDKTIKEFEAKNVEIKDIELERDLNDYLIARRTIVDSQKPAYEGAKRNLASNTQVKQAKIIVDELVKKYGKLDNFDNAAERIHAYQKRVLRTLVDSGKISNKLYNEILKKNPNYIPFDRIMEEEGVYSISPKGKKPFTEISTPIYKRKGSDLPIHNVFESVIKNTYKILDAAERNIVARTVINPKFMKAFPEEIQPIKMKVKPVFVKPEEIATAVKTFRTQTKPIVQEIEESVKKSGSDVPSSGPYEKLKTVVREALKQRGMPDGEANNYIRKMESHGDSLKSSGETTERIIKKIIKQTTETIISTEPVESTIYRASTAKPKMRELEYYVNGRPKRVRVSANLYRAMSGLDESSSTIFVKIFSVPSSILRQGATLTPEFMTKNIIRDQQTAIMQTTFGVKPFLDSTRAIADIVGKTDMYYDWLRSGGAYSGFVQLSRPQLKLAYKELMGRKNLLRKLNIITKSQDLSQLLEQATRVAVFEAARQKGKSPIEAGFLSRESTVDFGRRGSWTKDVSSLIPFFNAGLQGADKTARTFRYDSVGITAKGVALVTIPELLLYLINRKDPDYIEQPRWKKDLFYMTKVPKTSTYVMIPKPFLYGQMFGSIPERFFEYLDTKDKTAFDGLTESLVSSISPVPGDPASGLLPTAIKPIIESVVNYSFWKDQPIVPRGKEDLIPQEQYTRYTSEIAKEVGKILNFSPAKIENLLQGYVGGSSKYITGTGDLLVNAIKEADGEKQPKKPTDITRFPGLQGFLTKSPMETGQAESVSKFYENYKEISSLRNTFTKMQKEGLNQEAKKLLNDNKIIRFSSQFESVAKNLGEINKRIDNILNSSKISVEEKKKKINALNKQKVVVSQKTNKLLLDK